MSDPDESVARAKSARLIEGSIGAPILSFEIAAIHGVGPDGTIKVLLATAVQDFDSEGSVVMPVVAIAHLRGTPAAFASLKNAIDSIEAMLTKPKGPAN